MAKKCQYCGKEIAEKERFCSYCGKEQKAEGKICPKCGTELAAEAKFCDKCGASLTPPAAPKQPPVIPAAPQAKTIMSETPQIKPAGYQPSKAADGQNRKIIIGFAVAALLIVAIAAGIASKDKTAQTSAEVKQPDPMVEAERNFDESMVMVGMSAKDKIKVLELPTAKAKELITVTNSYVLVRESVWAENQQWFKVVVKDNDGIDVNPPVTGWTQGKNLDFSVDGNGEPTSQRADMDDI